jgi:hypothetical protein
MVDFPFSQRTFQYAFYHPRGFFASQLDKQGAEAAEGMGHAFWREVAPCARSPDGLDVMLDGLAMTA